MSQEWKQLRLLIHEKINSINTVVALKSDEKKYKLDKIKAELDLLIDDFISKSQNIQLKETDFIEESGSQKLTDGQIEIVSELLPNINLTLEKYFGFMEGFTKAKQLPKNKLKSEPWISFLFSNTDIYTVGDFASSNLWISLRNYSQLKEIVGLSKNSIFVQYQADIKEGLEFMGYVTPNQWKISYSFFWALLQRFKDDLDAINIATRLYLIHESVHFEHGLTSYSVRGIGNFSKTIEEADYQADTYAILTEFAYQIFSREKEGVQADYQTIVLRIIDIAINTTFSFIPFTALPIKKAQVRRVNRVLIWAYQYRVIKFINESDSKTKLEKIFKILSIKPIIEIHGPEVIVANSNERPRVLYDLEKFNGMLQMAIFHDNEIHRDYFDETLTMEMIDGLRNTDFGKICEAIGSFLTHIKITKKI